MELALEVKYNFQREQTYFSVITICWYKYTISGIWHVESDMWHLTQLKRNTRKLITLLLNFIIFGSTLCKHIHLDLMITDHYWLLLTTTITTDHYRPLPTITDHYHHYSRHPLSHNLLSTFIHRDSTSTQTPPRLAYWPLPCTPLSPPRRAVRTVDQSQRFINPITPHPNPASHLSSPLYRLYPDFASNSLMITP